MAVGEATYTVFLRDPALARDARTAKALARSRGVTVIDVRKHLKECSGVVEERVSGARAEALRRDLAGSGVGAAVFPDSEVMRFPEAVRINNARLKGEGFEVQTTERHGKVTAGSWLPVAWKDLIYLAWARVREAEKVHRYNVEAVQGPAVSFGMYGGGGTYRNWEVVREEKEEQRRTNYLDLFAIRPPRHFRISHRGFAFAGILKKVCLTSHLNLVALVGLCRENARRLVMDPSIRDLLDGNPSTCLNLGSPRAYELYLLWHIQMAFKGP